jgi:hypothetical protein
MQQMIGMSEISEREKMLACGNCVVYPVSVNSLYDIIMGSQAMTFCVESQANSSVRDGSLHDNQYGIHGKFHANAKDIQPIKSSDANQ